MVKPDPAAFRRLYEAAADPETLLIVPGADHNDDGLFSGCEMIAAIHRFLESLAQHARL